MPLPKQDHYELARDAALRRLRSGLDADLLRLLGAGLSDDANAIVIPSLCWEFQVTLSPFSLCLLPGRQDVSAVWQILVLDYLGAREPVPPRKFVSFADFPDGRGYQSAFEARVTSRLGRTAGGDAAALLRAAERLGATPLQGRGSPVQEPVRCILRFFPLLEFQVVRYAGDEDFPPSCNVLFSDNLLSIFSMEDGIVAAERLVSALEGKTPAAHRWG